MSLTPSTMLPLGTDAPAFSLSATDGATVSLNDFHGKKGLLVAFLCNHCPYVIHVARELGVIGKVYSRKDIGFVAFNSNDVANYPGDHPNKMGPFADEHGIRFPYLFDDTQAIAKAYRAACTPDFFLFDSNLRLIYRGQMDASRPGNDIPVTGEDLRGALDRLILGHTVTARQKPSMGCNIKWKSGEAPEYFASKK